MKYDLLIGADGVGSTVRSEMEHQLPGMTGTASTHTLHMNNCFYCVHSATGHMLLLDMLVC